MKLYQSTEQSKDALERNPESKIITVADQPISSVFTAYGTVYEAVAGSKAKLEFITLETREFISSMTGSTTVKVGYIMTDGTTTISVVLNEFTMSIFNERRSIDMSMNVFIPTGYVLRPAAMSSNATHTVLLNAHAMINVYQM